MPNYNFRIRKLSDRQLIDCLLAVANRCGIENVNVHIPIVSHQQYDSRDANWSDQPVRVVGPEHAMRLRLPSCVFPIED